VLSGCYYLQTSMYITTAALSHHEFIPPRPLYMYNFLPRDAESRENLDGLTPSRRVTPQRLKAWATRCTSARPQGPDAQLPGVAYQHHPHQYDTHDNEQEVKQHPQLRQQGNCNAYCPRANNKCVRMFLLYKRHR
jgi:hypothetical protein